MWLVGTLLNNAIVCTVKERSILEILPKTLTLCEYDSSNFKTHEIRKPLIISDEFFPHNNKERILLSRSMFPEETYFVYSCRQMEISTDIGIDVKESPFWFSHNFLQDDSVAFNGGIRWAILFQSPTSHFNTEHFGICRIPIYRKLFNNVNEKDLNWTMIKKYTPNNKQGHKFKKERKNKCSSHTI